LAKTRQRVNEAYGNLGPRVTLSGQYLRYAERQQSFAQGATGAIENKTATASLSLPVDITGVARTTIRAWAAQLDANEADVETARNDIRLAIKNAYYGVLKAKGAVGVAEAALLAGREQERTTTASKEVGTAAQVDVLRVQTQVRQFENDLLNAQNNLALAKASLNNSLARPIQTVLDAQDQTIAPGAGLDEDQARTAALEVRPEIRSIKFGQKALKGFTNAQRGGNLPSLSLSINHQRNIAAGAFTPESVTTGVIGLSWPIFDSGITRSRINQAKEDETQAQVRLEQLQLSVSLQIRQAVQNLANARDRQSVAERQVELATETLRLSNLRDKAGEGILLEVLDAQRQLAQARTQLNNARYDVLSAYAELQRAVGSDDLEAAVKRAQTGGKDE
jgi:outer membrane protein